MSEKKGFTGKLEYPFDRNGVLEVQLKTGKWYRVTERDFRAYDGPRRITLQGRTIKGQYSDTEMQEYLGPVYLYETNSVVEPRRSFEFTKGDEWFKRERQLKLNANRGYI